MNHFHAAGGMGFLIRELLDAGLLHEDVQTVWGAGPAAPMRSSRGSASDGSVAARAGAGSSGDEKVLRRSPRPFQPTGGLKLLTGNLGQAVIKISAVKPEHRVIEAPAVVFDSQAGAARRLQGRRARPRLRRGRPLPGAEGQRHAGAAQADPALGVLQDRGHKVALVTDGRMSGASGKVPAAIHVTPEALDGGADRQDPRRRHDPARRRGTARWR